MMKYNIKELRKIKLEDIYIRKKELKLQKHNKGKIATRIIAGILAAAMLLGSIISILYYIFAA